MVKTDCSHASTVYNKVLRKAKSVFKFNQGKQMCHLAKTNPISFWRTIKQVSHSGRQAGDSNIPLDDF
jgi:hypothetical protein